MRIYLIILLLLILLDFIYKKYTNNTMLISTKKAVSMIKNGEIKHVIDVRTQEEWNMGHYAGAIHIPLLDLETLEGNFYLLNSIKKDDPILIYCRTGRRALRAATILKKKYEFKNVYYIIDTYHLLTQEL
jgi:phage shock protein E